MHKDDQMTPLERSVAFRKGQDIDRVPILPFLTAIGARVAGMSLREMRANAQNQAKVQIDCYRRLGHDSLAVGYGLHGIGIALGSKINDPEFGVPVIESFVLEDLKNVDKLDMTKTERAYDPKLKQYYEVAEILKNELGHECGVGFSISGPFTAAASIYPTSQLLRGIIKDPVGVHKLLELCTNAIVDICKDIASLGVSVTLADPVASGTVLRKQNYLDFVFPYTARIVKELHEIGVTVGYHVCGNTTQIIEPMVDTGIDILSLDNLVDMKYAKEQVGARVCLMGNVDPVRALTDGTPNDVDLAVKDCFSKTYDSPCGYMLATGCDIPLNVPLENLDAFMAAGRKYGKWPFNPSLYQ